MTGPRRQGPTVSREEVQRWAVAAADAADDKNGQDTIILDVGAVLALTDFFVITSASNTRLVRTIADEVDKAVKAAGGPFARVEGRDDASWVLMDFGDVIVHVFLEDTRGFYDLERLWRDVPRVERPALA